MRSIFPGSDEIADNIWTSGIIGKTALSGVPGNVVGAGLESSGQVTVGRHADVAEVALREGALGTTDAESPLGLI